MDKDLMALLDSAKVLLPWHFDNPTISRHLAHLGWCLMEWSKTNQMMVGKFARKSTCKSRSWKMGRLRSHGDSNMGKQPLENSSSWGCVEVWNNIATSHYPTEIPLYKATFPTSSWAILRSAQETADVHNITINLEELGEFVPRQLMEMFDGQTIMEVGGSGDLQEIHRRGSFWNFLKIWS